MTRFRIRGTDRQVGGIGIMEEFEEFTETVEGENAADAVEKVRMARYAAGREHVLCKDVREVQP